LGIRQASNNSQSLSGCCAALEGWSLALLHNQYENQKQKDREAETETRDKKIATAITPLDASSKFVPVYRSATPGSTLYSHNGLLLFEDSVWEGCNPSFIERWNSLPFSSSSSSLGDCESPSFMAWESNYRLSAPDGWARLPSPASSTRKESRAWAGCQGKETRNKSFYQFRWDVNTQGEGDDKVVALAWIEFRNSNGEGEKVKRKEEKRKLEPKKVDIQRELPDGKLLPITLDVADFQFKKNGDDIFATIPLRDIRRYTDLDFAVRSDYVFLRMCFDSFRVFQLQTGQTVMQELCCPGLAESCFDVFAWKKTDYLVVKSTLNGRVGFVGIPGGERMEGTQQPKESFAKCHFRDFRILGDSVFVKVDDKLLRYSLASWLRWIVGFPPAIL
jgi:hypothetical protein